MTAERNMSDTPSLRDQVLVCFREGIQAAAKSGQATTQADRTLDTLMALGWLEEAHELLRGNRALRAEMMGHPDMLRLVSFKAMSQR